MVTTDLPRKHPPQNYLVVFQAMERLYQGDSFNLEDVNEEYSKRIRAVEAEKARLEGSLRDLKVQYEMDPTTRNLVLKEIKTEEALLRQAKERLVELKTKSQRVAIAQKIASNGLKQVQATIQDLFREIAEMPKDRKRKADSLKRA